MAEQPEEEKPEEETGHKRRWYQYSLRSLMIVMTLLCLWLAYITHEARKQKAAVAWVEEMAGYVKYDYEIDANGEWIRNAKLPGPDWLRHWIGIDYFCDVTQVGLSSAFDGPPVTDLSPLKGLTNLKELSLTRTSVTDLSPLKGLTNLKSLDLWLTPVTDLSPLESLQNLQELRLNCIPVTDLSPLAGLKNLKELRLIKTQISDLSPLKGLTDLEQLDFFSSPILGSVFWFEELTFSETPVSDQEVQKLQKALPNCNILWYGSLDVQ